MDHRFILYIYTPIQNDTAQNFTNTLACRGKVEVMQPTGQPAQWQHK